MKSEKWINDLSNEIDKYIQQKEREAYKMREYEETEKWFNSLSNEELYLYYYNKHNQLSKN